MNSLQALFGASFNTSFIMIRYVFIRAWAEGMASSDSGKPDDKPGSPLESQVGQVGVKFNNLQSGQVWFTSSVSRASSNFFNTFFGVASSLFSIFEQHADRISLGRKRCPLLLDHLLWVYGHSHGLPIVEQTGSQRMHRWSGFLCSSALAIQTLDV